MLVATSCPLPAVVRSSPPNWSNTTLRDWRRGNAETGDLDLYQVLSNTLRRLLPPFGPHRRSKDVTPDPLVFARSYQNDDGA